MLTMNAPLAGPVNSGIQVSSLFFNFEMTVEQLCSVFREPIGLNMASTRRERKQKVGSFLSNLLLCRDHPSLASGLSWKHGPPRWVASRLGQESQGTVVEGSDVFFKPIKTSFVFSEPVLAHMVSGCGRWRQ